MHGPLSFLCDYGDVLDSFEEEVLLNSITDVGVNQQRIGFRVNVFHHHLESVETAGFWHLNFSTESSSKILQNDSVGGSEECQHMFDEMFFVFGELLPVLNVLGKIDFLGSPKSGNLVFIHFPDVVIFDWKNDKSIRIFFQKRLRHGLLSILAVLRLEVVVVLLLEL